MATRLFFCIACALLITTPFVTANASPGDVFVPAHRTRDGHYVPPNVPPLSGGTHLARRPGKAAHAPTRQRAGRGSPVLAEARSLRH